MGKPFKCSWCPCTFLEAASYDAHMKRFGEKEWDHKRYWQEEIKTRR